MTHSALITRWSKMILVRVGAGVALGLVASSFLVVNGRDGEAVPSWGTADLTGTTQEDPDCDRAFASSCRDDVADAVNTALNANGFRRNAVLTDKGDDGAYFTEASHDPKFDPCAYSDGRRYIGRGTVLNPHADFNDCLPKVATTSELYTGDGGFDLEGGGDAAGTADPGTEYLDVFGPGGWLAGPLPGSNIPVAQILTGIPTISPDTPDFDVPMGDPVPLPAPALLFLTGLAGVIGVRRKKAAA